MGMVEQSKSDATIAWDESQSMVNALPAVVPHATGLHHYVEVRGGGLAHDHWMNSPSSGQHTATIRLL